MALNSTFVLPGAFGSVPAYYMVQSVQHDRVANAAHVKLAVFASAASRQAYKAAAAAIPGYVQSADQERQAAAALTPNSPEAAAAQLAIQQIQVSFSQAQQAMNQNAFLNDNTADIVIGADKIATVLDTNGNVSVPLLYTYLKTLPRFASATDA